MRRWEARSRGPQAIIRIAYALGPGVYGREVMEGMAQYARPSRPWAFRPLLPLPDQGIAALAPSGIIAQVGSDLFAAALAGWELPVVNVSDKLAETPFANVCTDNFAVGLMAAEHFIRQGLRHLGYVGSAGLGYSVHREAGLRKRAEDEELTFAVLHPPPTASLSVLDASAEAREQQELAIQWLRELPKPAGVLAVSDQLAVNLSELCRHAGIDIPGEVALLGVENELSVCETGWPPTSSIELGAQRVGYEAARLLDNIMAGLTGPEPKRILISPVGVVMRGSSRVVEARDEVVAEALRFIQRHAAEQPGVEDVSAAVALSRRPLERRFRAATGRTILSHVQEARVDLVKRLLRETHLSVEAISHRAGFGSGSRMRAVFAKAVGVTAREYRKQHQFLPMTASEGAGGALRRETGGI